MAILKHPNLDIKQIIIMIYLSDVLRGVVFGIYIILYSVTVIAQVKMSGPDSISMDEMYRKAEKINSQYLKKVKPIFSKKCFDCHSGQTVFPWYHSLPLIRQMLDHDIVEGKKHIEMSDDFPFAGHGSTEEDLQSIGDSINKDKMPPFKYLILHPVARLTKVEKRIVNEWINESLRTMNSQK